MNDFEERVRSALRTDLPSVEVEQLLHDVHRGAARRRRRRAAGAIAATVLVAAGVAGVTASLQGDERTGPEPLPLTQTPSPSPSETAPPLGGAQGVIDVAAVSTDRWFRLTANVGCAACSTVWQNEQSAEGGWEHLHDFVARDRAAATFGPVTHLRMAANGQDGWAWGDLLYSTHDGGLTWTKIDGGPGQETVYGRQLSLTQDFAWSLMRTDRGTVLWRSPLGADDWSRVDAPNLTGVSGMVTVDDRVALETSDEGLANVRLQVSSDGSHWDEVANPCAGENRIYPARSTAFMLCAAEGTGSPPPDRATIHRLVDLAWQEFGESSGAVTGVHAVADDRLLVVHENGRATLVTANEGTAVDLGLEAGEETSESSTAGGLAMLTTFDERLRHRLLLSSDGGLTWQRSE